MNLHVLISIFRRKWFFLNGRQKYSGCHFSIPHLLTFSPAASKRKCTVFNGESFRRAVVGVRTRTHQGMGDRPIDGHGLNEGGLITRDRKSGSSRCCRRLGRRTSICRFYKYLGSVIKCSFPFGNNSMIEPMTCKYVKNGLFLIPCWNINPNKNWGKKHFSSLSCWISWHQYYISHWLMIL